MYILVLWCVTNIMLTRYETSELVNLKYRYMLARHDIIVCLCEEC